LKGLQVRTDVNNDGMFVLDGKGKERHKAPLCNISKGGIIDVIPLIIITREGGELKILGAGGGCRSSRRGNSRCRKGGIRIHVKAVAEGNERFKWQQQGQ
jgi:hypothetical protein